MGDILIRRAQPDEAGTLTELSMRAKASWGYDEAFMARCRPELTITPEKMSTWKIWVADCAGEIVGMAALAGDYPDAELEDLMVEPSFQGHGLGAMLMDVLLEECRRRCYKSIGLDADPNAEPFYQKLGFSTVRVARSGFIPGRLLPRMVRTI